MKLALRARELYREEEVGQTRKCRIHHRNLRKGKVRREIAGRFPTLSFCNLDTPRCYNGDWTTSGT